MSAQTSQGVAARTVAMEAAPDRKKPGLLDRIADHFRRYWQLWILTAPALFFVGLFAYVPMWGIQLAFREFDPTKGLTGGKFVGFKYFNEFFHNPLFGEIMTNTIRISLWTLVMGFIFPIILALLINQIGSKKIKGFVQTVTYMPHFISVVVIVSMLNIFLSPGSGILGRFFGDESLMAPPAPSPPSTGSPKSGSTSAGTPSSTWPRSPAWTPRCTRPRRSMAPAVCN